MCVLGMCACITLVSKISAIIVVTYTIRAMTCAPSGAAHIMGSIVASPSKCDLH